MSVLAWWVGENRIMTQNLNPIPQKIQFPSFEQGLEC